MKSTGRIFSLLLVLCSVLSLFSSCGAETTSSATGIPETTSTSGSSFSVPASGSSISETTKEETDLKVNFQYTDEGYTDHAALSRKAAADGMVLLENKNQALPLKKEDTVALFGKGQIDFYKGGTGSGDVNALYTVHPLEGLRNKVKEGKVGLYEELAQKYEANTSFKPDESTVKKAAETANTAILVISRNTGEMYDRKNNPGDFRLSKEEETLLKQILDAGFSKTVVVMNIPSVMDLSFINTYPDISSLLIAWQPGMEGGNALADVLCGDVNPSGKLTDTIATSYKYYPSADTFNSISYSEEYREDIYVGYRYFETFDPEYKTVLYPFGYGLSYTDFELGTPTVEHNSTVLRVKIEVKNTGAVAGKEVVQVYYSAPNGILGNPAKELAAYAKTKLLAPGESEELEMSFALSDMAGYDDTGKIALAAYVLEQGSYNIYVGNSIKNAGERGVCHTYIQSENQIAEQLSTKLAPTVSLKRLTASGDYETLTPAASGMDLSGVQRILCTDYANASETVFLSSGKYKGTLAAGISSFTQNNTLTYLLNCPEEGDYTFMLYVGTAGSSVIEDCFRISCGSEAVTVDYTCSGSLYNPTATAAATLHLAKGQNKVFLRNLGISGNLLFSHFYVACPGSTLTEKEPAPECVEFVGEEKTVDSFKQVYEDPTLLSSFIKGMTLKELTNLFVGHGATVPGGTGTIGTSSLLNIAGMNTADGPAGLRLSKPQTAWPIGTQLACTFDRNLLYNVGLAIGKEAEENKVDIWLAPGMNIHRNPLCGRNFEYYSEDPFVTGTTATAVILGVQSRNVGVMIKHFALNNRETNRKNCDSVCSEKAIREIYLKGFEMAVKNANPWSVMSSYNKINGVYSSENRELLTDILRTEWGFEGFVSTDWENLAAKGLEIQAGNDISMPVGDEASLVAAYSLGLVQKQDLYTAAERILRTVLKSTAMEHLVNPPCEIIPADGSALRIKAVDWVTKADRIGSEVCEDIDGGYNPKFTETNGFLTYLAEASEDGTYSFSFRLASPNGLGAFDLYIDGQKVGHCQTTPTGGWQSWKTFEDKISTALKKGKHEIKILFTAEQININWFEISKK